MPIYKARLSKEGKPVVGVVLANDITALARDFYLFQCRKTGRPVLLPPPVDI